MRYLAAALNMLPPTIVWNQRPDGCCWPQQFKEKDTIWWWSPKKRAVQGFKPTWPIFALGINLNYKGNLTVAPWQGVESRWHGHLSLTSLGPQDKKARALLRKAITMVCFGLSLEWDLWWGISEGQFGKCPCGVYNQLSIWPNKGHLRSW